MSFREPVYNASINLWHGQFGGAFYDPAAGDPVGPPDDVINGQVRYGRQSQVVATGGTTSTGILVFGMSLLVPKTTDIRDVFSATGADIVEVPVGSGLFYAVQYVDEIGRGFANEHRVAEIFKNGPSPTPFPEGV